MNLQDGPAPETAVPPGAKRMRPYFCVGMAAVWLSAGPVLSQPQGRISPTSSKTQSLFEALRQGEALKATLSPNKVWM
jgi:hypothetical protein